MKYKIGDRVKVREDLINSTEYGNQSYFDRMGFRFVTIKEVDKSRLIYKVNETDYYYTDEMLDGIYEEDIQIKGIQELEVNNPNKFYIINLDREHANNLDIVLKWKTRLEEYLGTTQFIVNIGNNLEVTENYGPALLKALKTFLFYSSAEEDLAGYDEDECDIIKGYNRCIRELEDYLKKMGFYNLDKGE